MEHSRCVVNCMNRASRGTTIRFYRILKCILHPGSETEQISKRRYAVWLARINRKDLLLCEHHRICSDHFISGEIIHILFIVLIKKIQESLVHDTTNPDWAPSLKLGHTNSEASTSGTSTDCYIHLQLCKRRRDDEQEREDEEAENFDVETEEHDTLSICHD